MMNIYFPDEEITDNDLYFICYMIERVARKLHQKNKYVVNTIGRDALKHLISVANVLHCENPLQVEDDWIEEYHLREVIMTSRMLTENWRRLSPHLWKWEKFIRG